MENPSTIPSASEAVDPRAVKRQRRQLRWDAPIKTRWQRLAAWLNMLFIDHGVFRLIYWNNHEVASHLWRSAQPMPYHIEWAAQRGIRTIVNLRGGREYGSWPLEVEAIEHSELKLETITTRSREAPSKETIRDLKALFERISYPALVHCKSGADRAGFVSALWLVLMEEASPQRALKELSLRYGHVRAARTGILDIFFERWERDTRIRPMPFMQWVEEIYDPQELSSSFHEQRWASWIVDRVLRHE